MFTTLHTLLATSHWCKIYFRGTFCPPSLWWRTAILSWNQSGNRPLPYSSILMLTTLLNTSQQSVYGILTCQQQSCSVCVGSNVDCVIVGGRLCPAPQCRHRLCDWDHPPAPRTYHSRAYIRYCRPGATSGPSPQSTGTLLLIIC